jgi:hypothetical protein
MSSAKRTEPKYDKLVIKTPFAASLARKLTPDIPQTLVTPGQGERL